MLTTGRDIVPWLRKPFLKCCDIFERISDLHTLFMAIETLTFWHILEDGINPIWCITLMTQNLVSITILPLHMVNFSTRLVYRSIVIVVTPALFPRNLPLNL